MKHICRAQRVIRPTGIVVSEGRFHVVPRVALAMVALLGALSETVHAVGADIVGAASPDAMAVSMHNGERQHVSGRTLRIESKSENGTASGTIETSLDFPFAAASTALSSPASWCEILILHFNIKSCALVRKAGDFVVNVGIGRKFDDPSARVYHVKFEFSVMQRSSEAVHVELVAKDGPLSTRNYRIVLLLSPAAEQTVIHLSYAYDYGVAGKLAMTAYLGTLGRNKVGFTIQGEDSDGQPRYIRGMRGLVERNAMRYCFAVESYLRSLSQPQDERVEARLLDWFASSERYPQQLYEMDREEYLAMKRSEIARQQAMVLSGGENLPAAGR